jgi:hypothetical protein
MDGRIQEPLIEYIKRKAGVDYVDAITEAGPIGLVAEGDVQKTSAVAERLKVSIVKHGAKHVFVSGHHDCAGNPVDKETQVAQVKKTVDRLRLIVSNVEFHGLWLDENFEVNPVEID